MYILRVIHCIRNVSIKPGLQPLRSLNVDLLIAIAILGPEVCSEKEWKNSLSFYNFINGSIMPPGWPRRAIYKRMNWLKKKNNWKKIDHENKLTTVMLSWNAFFTKFGTNFYFQFCITENRHLVLDEFYHLILMACKTWMK